MGNNYLYKEVAKRLTISPNGASNATVSKLITSFQEICELGEIDPVVLLKRLNGWAKYLEKEITLENIKQTASPFFFEHALKTDLKISTYCIQKITEYLNSLTDDLWKDVFKDLDSYELKVSLIINYTFPTSAGEAFKFVLKDIALNTIPIPDINKMEKLIKKLEEQGRSLKGTFNSIRDTFCREDCMTISLFNFFAQWLFAFADLENNQASLRTIFNSDVIRDDNCLRIILKHQDQMHEIIKSAKEESQDFLDIIQEKLANNNDNIDGFFDFAKSLGIDTNNSNTNNLNN